MPHDFLAGYSIKIVEYAIALSFLALFVPFWRFVNGGQAQKARAPLAYPEAELPVGFALPGSLLFHPGHAWARLEGSLATVGLSDFAHKLVGPIDSIKAPPVGSDVGMGARAWTLTAGGKSVDMLAPVEGKVVAVNERVLESPALLKADPYGAGWLLKIEVPRPEASVAHLLDLKAARRHLEQAWAELRARLSPNLGAVMQDGGTPVDGIAPGIDPTGWDQIARKHFMT